MIGTNQRRAKPVEHIEVGENPTVCIHCDSRTHQVAGKVNGVWHEQCLHCGQRYSVTDAPPDEDEEDVPGFEPSEMTMKEVSDEDARHLFGLPPRSEGWGSF